MACKAGTDETEDTTRSRQDGVLGMDTDIGASVDPHSAIAPLAGMAKPG